MMKKWKKSFTLLALLMFSVFTITSCGDAGKVYTQEFETVTRPVAEVQTPDYSNHRALPKPEKETKKQIQYIELDGQPWSTLMMMTSLQGNVNRVEPSMYIVHDYVVEGVPGFNAPAYWLEKMDETYLDAEGKPLYAKTEYTDPYEMIFDNLDSLAGVVLYHERLTDKKMYGKDGYGDIYSDVALLNLTVMMCGQENAIALNATQYYELKEYLAERESDIEEALPIVGDTTKFMKRTEGQIDNSTASRRDSGVWTRCYEYAMTKYRGGFSEMAIAHNPSFQAAQFDYYIQNRIFVYNRSLSTGRVGDASEAENRLERDILGLTNDNTPVLGVWYLHLDEAGYVPFITGRGKYYVVSYESFNWSWSTGLPEETLETGEDMDIEYDETKMYVSFSFTEGDNNSYIHFKMPLLFDSPLNGESPFSWTIAPTAWEANPNMIRYFAQNWREGDGLCVPEAGIDYVNPAPPKNTAAGFYALTDEYLRRIDNANIRTLLPNPIDALAYAENMKNLDSILCGYGIGAGYTGYNASFAGHNMPAGDFLFRGVPYFMQYDGTDVLDNFKHIEETDNQFFSVSYSGWDNSLEDRSDLMASLDERFVVVTQKQMAKLYRDCYMKEYRNLTRCDFVPTMNRDEMGLLYKASAYADFDKNGGYRYADKDNYFIYDLNLDRTATEAALNLSLSGDYSIEMSNDYNKWYKIANGQSDDIVNRRVSIPKFLLGREQLFVRFGDGTESDGDGVRLHRFNLSTDLSAVREVTIDTLCDAAYNRDNAGTVERNGRKGEFTYQIDLDASVASGDVAVALSDLTQTVSLKSSTDGETFSEVALTRHGSTAYGKVSDLSGKLCLRVASETAVPAVKFLGDGARRNYVDFRPVGNAYDAACMLSMDPNELNGAEEADSQARSIANEANLVYRFNMADGLTAATLELTLSGHFSIAVSNDNVTYTELGRVNLGDDPDAVQTFDITAYATGGKTVYLKLEKSLVNMSKLSLRRIRITTDKTPAWLSDKILHENSPAVILYPNSALDKLAIDASLSHDYAKYADARGDTWSIDAPKDGQLTYKLDFNVANKDYWKQLGLNLDKVDVNGLKIVANVCNSYKFELSGDGTNWTTVAEYKEIVTMGSNKGNVHFDATSYLGANKTVYVRLSRGENWSGSHEAVLFFMRFAFDISMK